MQELSVISKEVEFGEGNTFRKYKIRYGKEGKHFSLQATCKQFSQSTESEESATTDETTEMVPGLEAGTMRNNLCLILKIMEIQVQIM